MSRVCLALLLLLLALVPGAATPRRPNVVILLLDDLGYGELGCQGNGEIPTPHLDSIARDGVRFTQGYVTAPFCSPSRAGLLTGRIQTRFGHELNPVGKANLDPAAGLPLSETTLAQRLSRAGYATSLVGKWHLGGTPPYHPQRRGFDRFFGFLHEGHFYVSPGTDVVSHLRPNEPPYDEENPLLRGSKPRAEKEYLTEAFTREAVSFVRSNRRRPFFLYLAYNAVHSPMQVPRRYPDRFPGIRDPHRRVFAGMLSALDDSAGAVLKAIHEAGLDRDTLVFCLSDNGGPTQELTSSNRPLRGGKGQLYEGGIRIPFLARWTGRLPAGKVEQRPVSSLDLVPTAMAAAGAPLSPAETDGVDLLPYLGGARTGVPHETLFWRMGASIALRRGDWKLVRQAGRGAPASAFELYDLARDPGESMDLAAREPERARELRAALDRLDAEAWRVVQAQPDGVGPERRDGLRGDEPVPPDARGAGEPALGGQEAHALLADAEPLRGLGGGEERCRVHSPGIAHAQRLQPQARAHGTVAGLFHTARCSDITAGADAGTLG